MSAQAYASGEYPAGGDLVATVDGRQWVVLLQGDASVVLLPVDLFGELRTVDPVALQLVERAE